MCMCVHGFTIPILAVADERTIILYLLSLSEYTVPSFVGNSYFCATGSRGTPEVILYCIIILCGMELVVLVTILVASSVELYLQLLVMTLK